MTFGLRRVETIVGKGENAGSRKECFQKPSVSGSLKVRTEL